MILVGRVSGVLAELVSDDLWKRVTPSLSPAPEPNGAVAIPGGCVLPPEWHSPV
jgi:hypothetical protein